MSYKILTPEEAALTIHHDEVIGVSGFTPAGDPKLIPGAIAQRAEQLHAIGEPFQITLFTGASTGDYCDGVLARAKAIKLRMPYQSNESLRKAINNGEVAYQDIHLSHMPQLVRYGFLPKITTAIVEAIEVTNDGKIYLSTAGGSSATYLEQADKILVEINSTVPREIMEMHDVYVPASPPNRQPIPINKVSDKVGTNYVQVDPNKIIGIVKSNVPNGASPFRTPGEEEQTIAMHAVEFFLHERKKGRLPKGLPFQSGVGNVANAVLSCFATHKDFDPIEMYTEVLQDSLFELIDNDRLITASGCSLTISAEGFEKLRKNIDVLKKKIILRQQEISNHPEIIRRLGIITMNTPIEVDIYGNINSTTVMGTKMMNGIGGSGDFTRNAYLSLFMTPSTAKNGDISSIVPMVTHVDHNEHSVGVIITEQGVADLRGLSPKQKVKLIIDNCAHPDYRPILHDIAQDFLKNSQHQTPLLLDRTFELHRKFLSTGKMK